MTYSIVARDPATGMLGVAVQSHFFGAGRLVCWAEAGVGAVATQAIPEVSYGPFGLDRLRAGVAPDAALAELVAADEGAPLRQVAMVDASGRVAAHTGAACIGHAGHEFGDGVSAQANMVASEKVWVAMVEAFGAAEGDLPARLLAALDAGEAAGGDARGKQSAALVVVGPDRVPNAWDGVLMDLRVEDHPEPLVELRRLVELNRAFGGLMGTLMSPGILLGPEPAPAEAVADGIATLDQVQDLFGAGNVEPTFWKAVILARSGRAAEARAALATATATQESLRGLVMGLTAAGILTLDQASALAGT